MNNQEEIILSFTTKTEKKALIRSIRREDVHEMVTFINKVSAEDTFLQFAGEVITTEDEQRYIDSELELIGTDDATKLLCFVDNQLAGVADIHRVTSARTRKLHIGRFGMIIDKDFRGQGIGEALMKTVISEAIKTLPGLKLMYLECFAENKPALSLYNKIGFKEVGRVPGALFRQGEYSDEVVMVLEV